MSSDSVTPLYKQVVNINEPTMLIVGLVVKACVVTAIDAQVWIAGQNLILALGRLPFAGFYDP